MSNASLSTLSVEILHHIFDYCDVQTILFSIRSVCIQLCAAVNTYDRFEITFESNSKSYFELISRLISIKRVASLVLVGNSISRLFISSFCTRQCNRLRLLTLRQISVEELDNLLQNVNIDFLVSLSIELNGKEHARALALVSSVLIRCKNIQKLYLNDTNYTMEHVLWPVQCGLKHLTIGMCGYSQYLTILHQLPYLRTFAMKGCVMNTSDDPVLLSSVSTSYPQITALTITDCSLSMMQLESLLSLTPALVHLVITSYRRPISDPVFDGSRWEQFIQTTLPLIDKFEFCFSYTYPTIENLPDLDSLIISFRTPFWLVDKRWFVTCDHLLATSAIRLYSTPFNVTGHKNLFRSERCIIPSIDSVGRLTRQSLNETVTVTIDKVCTKISARNKTTTVKCD